MSETEPDLAAIVRDIAAEMLTRKDRGTVASYSRQPPGFAGEGPSTAACFWRARYCP